MYNIIHLIYKTKPYEEQYKDYAFAPGTMREHWRAGLDRHAAHARASRFLPAAVAPPVGVVTHDVHR